MGKEVVWNDKLSVRIGVIDKQHKQLIELANSLYRAYIEGTSEEKEKECLVELINYTKYHFSEEEKLMEKHDYPQRKSHAVLHQSFVVRLSEICEMHQIGQKQVTRDVLLFLKEWLFDHILKKDKELGLFLSRKGVA